MKQIISISILLLAFIAMTNAQVKPIKNAEKKVEEKPVKKANQRPIERKSKKELFDGADVKTMSEKCVVLNTEKGSIRLEMYPESAPETVRSFLNLVTSKALDATTFSRIVPDFVIQGGDLYTNENITDESKFRAVKTIPDEPNQIRHEKGILSMARPDEPNSATTNFFILLAPSTFLDNKFAAFGRVTEGIEVVETINKMAVEAEKPKNPVRIKTAEIISCSPTITKEGAKESVQ